MSKKTKVKTFFSTKKGWFFTQEIVYWLVDTKEVLMNDDALRQLFIAILGALIVTSFVAVNYGALAALVTHMVTGFLSFGGLYIYVCIQKRLMIDQ